MMLLIMKVITDIVCVYKRCLLMKTVYAIRHPNAIRIYIRVSSIHGHSYYPWSNKLHILSLHSRSHYTHC